MEDWPGLSSQWLLRGTSLLGQSPRTAATAKKTDKNSLHCCEWVLSVSIKRRISPTTGVCQAPSVWLQQIQLPAKLELVKLPKNSFNAARVKVLPGWCWPPSRCNEGTSQDSSRNLPLPGCTSVILATIFHLVWKFFCLVEECSAGPWIWRKKKQKYLPGRRMFLLRRPRFFGLRTPCELGTAPTHL